MVHSMVGWWSWWIRWKWRRRWCRSTRSGGKAEAQTEEGALGLVSCIYLHILSQTGERLDKLQDWAANPLCLLSPPLPEDKRKEEFAELWRKLWKLMRKLRKKWNCGRYWVGLGWDCDSWVLPLSWEYSLALKFTLRTLPSGSHKVTPMDKPIHGRKYSTGVNRNSIARYNQGSIAIKWAPVGCCLLMNQCQ